ncbi:glycosyltransferase family 2 protein [Acinetobacter sp. YH12138]|uniref:glycosyltransferase family 2 protein n=1 Tax=Acinetobacter sp. YH12138 TaxID=2601122 RepID=UPI0015D115BA|nr:glycosyltransferase family 2 protein [Acinetobacter sp. YH12138]QOW51074.1 glycosyltransferase family 2 protein [Acinetobacter sp. YH12138]
MKLTIFTPTYNREMTLKRLYKSLKSQKFKDFEWLIIDDGSDDQTESLINDFIGENILDIKYHKQNNLGKQACWNKALDLSQGKLFCGVDSDDILYGSSNLYNILHKYSDLLEKDEFLIGIRCNSINSVTQKVDGISLTKNIGIFSYFDELLKKDFQAERIDIFKKDILLKFKYPISGEIKFIPENWFYIEVTKNKYKFLYINEILGFYFDDENQNRLSKSNYLKHAKGHLISSKSVISTLTWKNFFLRPDLYFKNLLKYSFIKIYLIFRS